MCKKKKYRFVLIKTATLQKNYQCILWFYCLSMLIQLYFCLLSTILLLISSPFKLCQVGWGRCTFSGFSRNIWLGSSPGCAWATQRHSQSYISHSRCVFRSIVLFKGKHSAQSEVLNAIFSLRLSQYFGAFSFSSILTSPSVPAAEEQPHSMRLLPAHFTFGMVLCRWWVVPGFLQTWCLELRLIRPQNIVSHSLRVL